MQNGKGGPNQPNPAPGPGVPEPAPVPAPGLDPTSPRQSAEQQVIIPPPFPGGPIVPPTRPSSNTNCFDSDSNCAYYRSMCTAPIYKNSMKQKCAKTCGWCSAQASPLIPAPSTFSKPAVSAVSKYCLDTASDCAYKRSMCQVGAYASLMKKICPKTCGLC